jgi:hypothetical protein
MKSSTGYYKVALCVATALLAFLGTTRALECYECVGKSCHESFGRERDCEDKIDTCVTIYANETRTPENVLARNCSLAWMKWEGECNLVQPNAQGKNTPRAKLLKGFMCLCKGDLCNEASSVFSLGLLLTTLIPGIISVLVARWSITPLTNNWLVFI